MHRHFVLTAVSLLGCTAGPDQATWYHGTALQLDVQFVDPAPGATFASIGMNYLDLCGVGSDPPPDDVLRPLDVSAFAKLAGNEAKVQLENAETAFDPDTRNPVRCNHDTGELRFFQLSGRLSITTDGDDPFTSMEVPGEWSSFGDELAFASYPTTFMPFGPDGQSLELPAGYSLLRRQCVDGALRIENLRPTAEAVRLQRLASDTDGQLTRRALERQERALLETCNVQAPENDLGMRLSIDHARRLAFTSDGAAILYVASPDAADIDVKSPLRSVALADGATKDIVGVPFAGDLAADSGGQVYVVTNNHWARVVMAAGQSASLQALTVDATAMLSPDGRWFASFGTVWDATSNNKIDLAMERFIAWSPDSSLVLATSGDSLHVRPVTGASSVAFSFGGPFLFEPLAWNGGMPILVTRPIRWTWELLHFPPPVVDSGHSCSGCYGLAFQPSGGVPPRQVLGASAGLLSLPPLPPAAPFVLAWARQCLGLHNTICTHSLLRVNIADGNVAAVAVASEEVPLALSPDSKTVALAASQGIYVKPLP